MKKILITALLGLLYGASAAGAMKLEDITPDTVEKLENYELYGILQPLDRDAKKAAARTIADNITTANFCKIDRWTILRLIEANPSLADYFAALFMPETLFQAIDSGAASVLIDKVLNANPKLATQIAGLINATTIDRVDTYAICKIIANNSALAEYFANILTQKTLACSGDYEARLRAYGLVQKILELHPQSAKTIAQFITKDTISTIDSGIIRMLINADHTLAQQFAAMINPNNISMIDPQIIGCIIHDNEHLEQRLGACINNSDTLNSIDIDTFAMLVQHLPEGINECLRDNLEIVQRMCDDIVGKCIEQKVITACYASIITMLVEINPTSARTFAKLVTRELIGNSCYTTNFIIMLIKADKQAAHTIAISDIWDTEKPYNHKQALHIPSLITAFIDADPTLAKIFINKSTILSLGNDIINILTDLDNDPRAVRYIASLIDEDTCTKIDPEAIRYLVKKGDATVRSHFQQLYEQLQNKKLPLVVPSALPQAIVSNGQSEGFSTKLNLAPRFPKFDSGLPLFLALVTKNKPSTAPAPAIVEKPLPPALRTIHNDTTFKNKGELGGSTKLDFRGTLNNLYKNGKNYAAKSANACQKGMHLLKNNTIYSSKALAIWRKCW